MFMPNFQYYKTLMNILSIHEDDNIFLQQVSQSFLQIIQKPLKTPKRLLK